MNNPKTKPTFGTGIYLPEKVLTNQDIEARKITLRSGRPLLAQQILEKIGVERRHIAAENQTVADLGYKAAKLAIKDKNEIKLVLASSSHPTNFHVSGEIAKKLGMKDVEVYDIHAACSGSALMFAQIFDRQKELDGKQVLLVAAEKFSQAVVDLTHPDALTLDSSLGQTIFGDGAAAVNFNVNKDIVIHSAISKPLEDKSGKTDLILMAMGENKFMQPCHIYPVAVSKMSKDLPKGYFTQDGPRVFEDVVNNVPDVIREAVNKAKLKPADIDLVVIHPGSKRLVEALKAKLAPDFEVFSDYADANMSSVSLLYSFIKALNEGLIGKGSKVVLSGFGAGSPHLYSSTVVIELK